MAAYLIPPGELLEQELAARGIDVPTAARELELSAEDLRALFRGHEPLTADIANSIEAFLGTKAYIWQRLEAKYRSRLAERDDLEQEAARRTATG